MIYKSLNIKLKPLFFLITVFIGVIHIWLLRYFIESDSIPFIDIGESFFHGDWQALVNGVWSPMYAVILGLFLHLFKPDLYFESTVLDIANLLEKKVAVITDNDSDSESDLIMGDDWFAENGF